MLFAVQAFQSPSGGDADPTTPGYTSANSWISTNLTSMTNTLTAIKAKTDTISTSSGWKGCYRKTCEVHNATNCTPNTYDVGETDKGLSCPRNGGLWTAQDNSSMVGGYGPTSGWAYGAGYYSMHSSKFNADYYVTCERWCCN